MASVSLGSTTESERSKSTTSSSPNYGYHYYSELYFRSISSLSNAFCQWEVSQPLFRCTCTVPSLDHWATALHFSPVKKQQIQMYLVPARPLLQNRALFIHCRVHSILRRQIKQQKTYFWILLIPVSFVNFFFGVDTLFLAWEIQAVAASPIFTATLQHFLMTKYSPHHPSLARDLFLF